MARRCAAWLLLAFLVGFHTSVPAAAETTLLNVSYDPTRRFYSAVNKSLRGPVARSAQRDRNHLPVAWRLGGAGACGKLRS